MARTALTIVGGLVGAYFGFPQLGLAVGALVGNAVDPQRIQGPRIGETGAQTSSEGAPRAIVYGTAPVTGNILACGPVIVAGVSESSGKGGGTTTDSEQARRTYAIRICEGPIKSILRIWEDDKLVYDMRPGSAMVAQSQQWLFGCWIYLGDETQLPDPFLNANVAPYDHPAHRGTAYIVMGFRDLTDRRGSVPQYRFEVSTTKSAVQPGADWFDSVPYIGNGSIVTLSSNVDMTDGGMIWVARTDGTEVPKILYQVGTGTGTYIMDNRTVNAGGGPPANPVSEPDATFGDSSFRLPASLSTPGGTYMAYLFKKSTGNFDIAVYTGNGVAGKTVSHSLGSAPKMHFVRQLDETTYTFGWMHLGHFNGLSFLLATADNNVQASSQQWNDTPPSSTLVTLGNHPQVNGNGKTYIMFLFGGDDVYNGIATTGNNISVGFDPQFAWAKRRTALSTTFRYNLITGASTDDFTGSELMVYGETNAGVASTEDRITKTTDGVYQFSQTGGPSGTWTSLSVDFLFIKGSAVTPEDTIILADIVSDICDRCELDLATEVDVSELTDVIDGLVLAGEYNGGSAIDTARSTYFFDKAEYDKKIWFPKRGKAVVDTLTIDDLVEVPDLSRREQAIEFPKKMHLQYQHAASGYATVKATSERSSQDARVVGEVTAQTPFVLNEDLAAQTAAKMHKVTWTEAEGEMELSVPESMLSIIPSDCIGLVLRNTVNRYRIEKQEQADGILKWTLRRDRQSAYTSNVSGIPIPDPTPPPSTIVGDTTLVVADIGVRQDSEDDLNYLVAVTGANPAWYGATVERSLDAGASYTEAARITRAARIGTLVSAVADADEYPTDTTNTVTVSLIRDGQTLESITTAQFLSEGGAFLLQNADGSWEVMQYRDCHETSSGDFVLSHLQRGRLNSGTSAHIAGAKFVMLEDMTHVVAQSAWIGQTLTHRAPSLSQASELAISQSRVYAGNSQKEWPVASLTLSRATNIVTATWNPRHRLGSDDAPVASVNFRGFRVTIVGTGTITFDTVAQTFSQDVSSIGGTVTVTVQSLNRITGAGPATSGTI